MSHWNHRVVKYHDLDNENACSMSEVFYDDEGRPWGYMENFSADSLEGLREQLYRMLLALDKPALHEVDFDPELKMEMRVPNSFNTKPVVNFTGDAIAVLGGRSTIYGVKDHPDLGNESWVSTSTTLSARCDAEGEVYEVETLNTIYRKVRNV